MNTYEVLLIGSVLGIVSTSLTIFLVWISWVCDRRKKAKAKPKAASKSIVNRITDAVSTPKPKAKKPTTKKKAPAKKK